MQQALFQTAGLIARLWLAVFFMAHVVEHSWPGTLGAYGYAVETGSRVLDIAAAAVFALVSLWLLLGIYSRVVALIGMVICGASLLLFDGSMLRSEFVVSAIALLVLSVVGGGALRLHAGGWRLRDCL